MSPLPFGVLSPGHPVHCAKASVTVRRVSIAFRRSVPRPRNQRLIARPNLTHVSIAFRRSVPRPRADGWPTREQASSGLHCLSAFCPPATQFKTGMTHDTHRKSPLPFGVLSPGHNERGTENWIAVARSHHCLSAFCPPATWRGTMLFIKQKSSSPLPFGVLSPGHTNGKWASVPCRSRHHCLSAFCPPATSLLS